MNTTTKAVGGVIAVIAFAIGLSLFADRGYGEVSPTGYRYATALYSACNQRDREKLDQLSELIDRSTDQQEISAEEHQWLTGIIRQGRDGQWTTAAGEVRQLMLDQVREI